MFTDNTLRNDFENIQNNLDEIISQAILEQEDNEALLDLVNHADKLKSMSLELLIAEQRVRELSSLQTKVDENYEWRENAYIQRLQECQQVSRQQSEMIQTLADICQSLEIKRDHKSHWFGCIGTGKVIHAFENQEGIKEVVVAGFGLIGSLRYDYMFHIKDRQLFANESVWIPDDQVECCQLSMCFTRFSWLQRKHHCRRCGKIVCQRHGLNKLPLFSKMQDIPTWSRVCDMCFISLILYS
ncbi:hypothetical protein G6F56_010489 [Rhizopus delemar]|nr:hypothetical protein G6F56_010489 [Rhizopus delemar]